MRHTSILAPVVVLVLAALVLGAAADAAETGKELVPKGHFKIKRPANLSKAEALTVYENIGDKIAKGYAASGDPTAKAYRKWRRYNDAPYKSKTHGNRYLNNFANMKAAKLYGDLKKGVQMPTGAVIAKDSFTVTGDGGIFAGALSIMEKLPTGTSPKTGDWRYIMIMPDGSLFDDTHGDGADKVGFCHGCHVAAEDHDYLYFLPDAYKRQFLGD